MKTVSVNKALYSNYLKKAAECFEAANDSLLSDAEDAVRDAERFYLWVKKKLAY
jgi:hypothetical protein